MTAIDRCPICGEGSSIEKINTIVSEFVSERISLKQKKGIHICHCKNCSFAFYDHRFSDKESYDLYKNYRDGVYQKQREKSEYWYTAKINEAMNHNRKALEEQKKGRT